MKGFDLFPLYSYYKDHIIDAIIISRNKSWFAAILLINDPKSSRNVVKFYK